MTDSSELKQIIKEIRELTDKLDERIDTLQSLICVETNESEEKYDNYFIKETVSALRRLKTESAFNKEIEEMIREFEPILSTVGSLSINEVHFLNRAFPAKYYINTLVGIYNNRTGYSAYFTDYKDPQYTNKLFIGKK